MKGKIFIIEDEASIVQLVQHNLEKEGFVEKTSATIMMLLSFLIVMNFIAVYLRQKFEKRWN